MSDVNEKPVVKPVEKPVEKVAEEPELFDIESLIDYSLEIDIPRPDPEFHYRWVNGKLRERLARFLRAGYNFVEGSHAERIYGKRSQMYISAAGRVEVGDLVLMAVPVKRYDMIRALIARKAQEQASGVIEQFQAETSQIAKGISGYVVETAEFMDMKKSAERGQDSRVGYTGTKGR